MSLSAVWAFLGVLYVEAKDAVELLELELEWNH